METIDARLIQKRRVVRMTTTAEMPTERVTDRVVP